MASGWTAAALCGAAVQPDATPVNFAEATAMKSMQSPPVESTASRVARLRRIATRAENDCAAANGRPDLLLRAALHRHAAGDVEVARAQAEALLSRAEDDPDYAPRWLVHQALDLVAQLDGGDDDRRATD